MKFKFFNPVLDLLLDVILWFFREKEDYGDSSSSPGLGYVEFTEPDLVRRRQS